MMENKIIELGPINGSVTVSVIRKNIKNVHLKVFRDFSVVISVPNQVADEWINDFLQSRAKWIDTQITKYRKSSGYNNLLSVNSGTSTQILGKDMRIYKIPSLNNSVDIDEKKVNLFLKQPNDDKKAQQIFNKWWRCTAMRTFEREMNAMYDKVFRKYDVLRPNIVIRKMKTLWGSCSPSRSKITLNEYLLKADIRCIQYVILHELTHLLYPNHNKEFYDFLTIQMPDWKERKKQLDQEVVQWL